MKTALLRLASRRFLPGRPSATWLWRNGRKSAIVVRDRHGWRMLLSTRHDPNSAYVMVGSAREAMARAERFLESGT